MNDVPLRPHLRPRFVMWSPKPPEEVRALLEERLVARGERVVYRVRKSCVLCWINRPFRRFWSPSMEALLRPHPEGTLIVGRFGPSPALMTGYFFAAILLSFLIALSLAWGWVQATMGESPRCLLGSSAGILGLVGIWVSSRVGTAWAHDQMAWLAETLDGVGEVRDDEAHVLVEGA